MSQVTQPRISLPTLVRPRRSILLAALLALAAGAAVVLALALGNESQNQATPVSAQAQPSVRSDGGPEETSVATSVASLPVVGPDESAIAVSVAASTPTAAIGRDSAPLSGPDESRTAQAVGASSPQSSGGPDESHTAASISGR